MTVSKKKQRGKKRPCPSCGLPFLKGKIVLRIVAGGVHKQRVCQACAKLAVPVLASDAKAMCENCGTNLARACYGCIGKVIDQQARINVAPALAKQAAAAAKARREEGES